MPDPNQQSSSPATDPAALAAQTAAAAASVAASQSSQPAGTVQPGAQLPSRPDYLPESFWDKDKGQVKPEFKAHLDSLEKLNTENTARLAVVPQTPDLYKAVLPPEVKLPENVTIDEKDPRLAELRKVAHEEKWTQAQFTRVFALEANRVIQQDTLLKQAIAERDKQMGENGAARVVALSKWIDSVFSDPREAAQVKQTLWTPVICRFYEQVQKMATGQGVQSFSGLGREANPRTDGLPSNWDKMSAVDKRTYNLTKENQAAGGRR